MGREDGDLEVGHAPLSDRRGAAGVGKNDTAWSYRDANFAQVIIGVDPDPALKDEIKEWCVDYFEALHPYSLGGAR